MPRTNTSGVTDRNLPEGEQRVVSNAEEEATEWDGNSSSTSTDSRTNEHEKSETPGSKPARETERRSTVESRESSTASGAASRRK